MRWHKRDRWRASIAIAGMLLLLVLIVWVPVSAVGAHERASGHATLALGTVQATPTEDATVTALNKEKLAQEVDQLKNQNYWAWTTIGSILVGFAGLLAALYSFITWIRNRQDELKKRGEEQQRWLEDRKAERERRDEEQQRWLKDQEAEREKRAEERFQSVVAGLGSEREGAKVGAAIMLRTFLQPGYKQFYRQSFDLAVAHLRSRPVDPNTPTPHEPSESVSLDPLSQALITVFKESFPLAREVLIGQEKPQFDKLRDLDASGIRLDHAFLRYTDLEGIWMRDAFLSDASLRKANLGHAYLTKTDLSHANLRKANLGGARLRKANLSRTHLDGADLRGAYLNGADLRDADLRDAYLGNAHLNGANLSGADLRGVNMNNETDLRGTKLQGAKYNTKVIHEKDAQGKLVTVEPTQWPQGFDPDGAVDVESPLFNFILTAGNIAEFVYPLAQFIEQTHPDYIIACDRGARMIAFAVHMMYGQLYGSLPTQDHRINFRKISRKVPVDAVKAALKPDVERMLAAIESPTVLVLDDWVHTGETKELVQDVLSELSGGKVNVLFGVMRGGGADVTGSSDSVGMTEWHDNVDLIGVEYDGSTLTPHSVGSPAAIAYRRKAVANIQQFVQNLGFAASRNRKSE